MQILQELEKSLKSDAPSYMEFLYRYNPKKKQVFAFYEGDEDSSFYHRILESALAIGYELEEIVAGCKNNVLKLHREFDWSSYNYKQIAFFVDRDLSYWLDDSTQYGENVFVTDEYSVENYVATPKGFRAWLIHFEGFARAKKKEIDFIVSEYECNIAKFEKEMMPIMAQAIVAKRNDDTISLNDFKLSKNVCLLCIQNGHISFKICEDERIFSKWKLSSANQDEITTQVERFTAEKDHYSVRGKWILCFMAEFGEYLRLNSNIFAPSLGYSGKASPTCAVPTSQCLSVLAPYCNTSISKRLELFLKSTYLSYYTEAK